MLTRKELVQKFLIQRNTTEQDFNSSNGYVHYVNQVSDIIRMIQDTKIVTAWEYAELNGWGIKEFFLVVELVLKG